MKKSLFALLYTSRVLHFVSWWNRKSVPIICYHSVVEEPTKVHSDPYKQHIPVKLFQRHLDYLQSRYNVVSLTEHVEAIRSGRRLPDSSVVLTFDDGFEDFYSVAAPHLNERQLPATVFVITERADGRSNPTGESFLSWDQIRELAASGIEIGSHTCSHPRLSDLSPDEVAKELSESRATIENKTGQSQVPLSFPYGQTSAPISRLAESLGYSCAVASDSGAASEETSLYALRRTVIASDDDLATFAARVSGLTAWAGRWRRFLRPSEYVTWKPSFSGRYEARPQEFYID